MNSPDSPGADPTGAAQLPGNYRDCLDFLFARNQFAVKLGLDNIRALLDRLGRPQDGLSLLHVAGTNGKGSVCANLAAMLRAAGFSRVGLYTSPHLVSFRERIQVDGEPVPKDWIVGWMRRAMGDIQDLGVTYFEIVTAMALCWFREAGCEAVVLETGLGGRLDATNAVRPAVTAITSVSLDHTQILGDTVEAIWREKIAILKPGVPMVVREDRPHLLAELEDAAARAGSPVITLRDFPWSAEGAEGPEGARGPEGAGELEGAGGQEGAGRIRFRTRRGERVFPADLRREDHQRENLALSLLVLEAFLEGRGRSLPTAGALEPCLRESRVPGRTQLLTETGMLPLVLDGAHNPGGMAALAAWLRKAHPGKRILALFSLMRDKDVAAVYRQVAAFADEVLFVPLEGRFPRALTLEALDQALAAALPDSGPGSVPGGDALNEAAPSQGGPQGRRAATPREFPLEAGALAELLRAGNPGQAGPASVTRPDLVVACGSLYLLGELIPLLVPWYSGLAWFRQFEGEG